MREKDGRLWEPAGCLPGMNSLWARAGLGKARGFVQGMPEKKLTAESIFAGSSHIRRS